MDFNQDNHIDLLITVNQLEGRNSYGYYIFAIIDLGQNEFKLVEIPDFQIRLCHLAIPLRVENKQLLLLYQAKNTESYDSVNKKDAYKGGIKIDTLIYKFESFIELINDTTKLKVKSLFYRTSGVLYGPYFSVSIDSAGNAIYSNYRGPGETGVFKALIKRENLDQIFGLLNYLQVNKLKDKYQVYAFDQPDATMRIYLSDGSKKEIGDYGLQGTNGLSVFYNLMYELRKNQNWHK